MDRMLDLDTILTVIAIWVGIGVVALVALRRTRFVAHGLFPISALMSLALAAVALHGLFVPPQSTVLRLGLPGLPFHLRMDSLSAYFLAVIGATSAGPSIFSAGYVRKGAGTPPGERDPPRRIFVPAAGAHRCPRDPAVFRGAAGQYRRFHVRQSARPATVAVLGVDRVRTGRDRFRRKGRHRSAACLAAGGPSGGAVAGFRADERNHAEDRRLCTAAGCLRPAARSDLVVGRAAARARRGNGHVWSGLYDGPGRHEATACFFIDREYRPDIRRHRPGADVPHVRNECAGGPGADRDADSRGGSCALQEPAVPGDRH